MRRAVDYFIEPDASKIADKNFKKSIELGKNFVSEGIYKNKDEIAEERQKLQSLNPTMVSHPRFFHRDKTFLL